MELNNIFAQNNDTAFNKNHIIKRIRRPKTELFNEERKQILNKINDIMGINEKNNILYLYDIENDNDKKNKILVLLDDIKKYFKASKWGFIRSNNDDNYFSLVKAIYKNMNYQIISKITYIERNKEKIRTTKYIITQFEIKESL